jgi:diaminopimelate epimerase
MRVVKGHAYGNDFLCVPMDETPADTAALARAMCHRHEGIGADGLILYTLRPAGARMYLLNADGSRAELSGNGLRCLAALVARAQGLRAGAAIEVETDAGPRPLHLLETDGRRFHFRTGMGIPHDLLETQLSVGDERVRVSVLGMGNPQCVVLGPLPDPGRFARLGPALATHPFFPQGTNVEFAEVEAPDRVRILIWERGVGPTTSSGTGTSAAAVAAAAHGGAARVIEVIAPGGTQRVEWRDDQVYLTGWAELVLDGHWIDPGRA